MINSTYIKEYANANFKNGLSGLAKKADIAYPQLSRYANGHESPSTPVIQKLIKAGLDPKKLLIDEDVNTILADENKTTTIIKDKSVTVSGNGKADVVHKKTKTVNSNDKSLEKENARLREEVERLTKIINKLI